MDLYQKFNLSQRKIHFQDGKEITLPEEGTVITKEELPSADNIATLSGENTFENMNVFKAGLSTLGISVGQYGNSGGSIQTTTLGTGELGVAMVSHTGDATVQAKTGANILSQGGTGILLHDSSNGDKALQINSDGIAFTGSGVVVPNATADTQAPNFSQVKNLTATSNTNGLIKLATAEQVNYGGAVGLSSSGQARVQLMTHDRAGTARTGGKGIQVDGNGVLSMLHRADYSGFEYDGNSTFINAAEQTIHPTAGTAGKVAFDTEGKLVVLNASSTVPGTVLIGANENATGDYTVLSASSIKTYVGNTISTLKSGANNWTGNNTFTGVLTVPNDPVALTDAANKKYVDAAVLAGTAWQGGLDVSGATTNLTINSEVRKGFFWRISAGTITVNNVNYTVGDLIVANADFGADAEKPISSFSFFNGQDTDVVKLTETQTLTNKTLTSTNLSATSNTYRDATSTVSGAVTLATAMTDGSNAVVTSDLLHSVITPINGAINTTIPATYAKLEGGNAFEDSQSFELGQGTYITASYTYNEPLVEYDNEISLKESRRSDTNAWQMLRLNPGGIHIGYNPEGPVGPTSTEPTSLVQGLLTVDKINLINQKIINTSGLGVNYMTATLPGGTYNVVGDTTTQTLTNKTLTDSTNVFRDATTELNGAVKLADSVVVNGTGVVTSGLLHTTLAGYGVLAGNNTWTGTNAHKSESTWYDTTSTQLVSRLENTSVGVGYVSIQTEMGANKVTLNPTGLLFSTTAVGGLPPTQITSSSISTPGDISLFGDFVKRVKVNATLTENYNLALPAKNGTLAIQEDNYTKAQVDGVDTGAEVTTKMNEISAQLKDWEEVTGETLSNEVWAEVVDALQRYSGNPAEKQWVTTDETSSNPYRDTPPLSPVVDLCVTKASGPANNTGKGSFNKNTNQLIFLPFATDCTSILPGASSLPHIILPNATNLYSGFRNSASSLVSVFYFPKMTTGYGMFSSCVSDFSLIAPNASNLDNAFNYTKMSAGNIAKTLNSLPSWSSGTHRVGFMGASGRAYTDTTETFTVTDEDGVEYSLDNCPLFTLDDGEQTLRKAYVLAIVKKGWEVVI